MINSGTINSTPINTTQTAGAVGIISVDANITVTDDTGYVFVNADIEVYGQGYISVDAQATITNATGVISVDAELGINEIGYVSTDALINVYDMDELALNSQNWTAKITIDGADYSDRIIDIVSVEAEEGMARIATFKIKNYPGIIDPVSFVGSDVVIHAKINTSEFLIFTGIVDVPEFDQTNGVMKFLCTDNLQEIFETQEKDRIAAIVGGYYSEAVFNNKNTGWDYALDRISTIPASIDLTPARTERITNWEAKITPDFTFNTNRFIENSERAFIANRRNIKNSIDISLKYRFKRLKERVQRYDWRPKFYLCDYLLNPYKLPTSLDVKNAVNATGWEIVQEPVYTYMPGSRLISCYGKNIAYVNNTDNIVGATFKIGKRFSQDTTEEYKLRVYNQESINKIGEINIALNFAAITDYDDSFFESSSIVETDLSDFGTPLTDVNGDSYVNKDSAADRNDAIDASVNLAKTEIRKSHRNNRVEFATPLYPVVDVIHTVQLNADNLTAKGKVGRVTHTINTNSGESISRITIKLSKKLGTGVGQTDGITPPDTLPKTPDTQSKILKLDTHIGGQSAPPFDEAWGGLITNYQTTFPGDETYNFEFVINTPDINEQSIDHMAASNDSNIHVDIPDDLLIMSA